MGVCYEETLKDHLEFWFDLNRTELDKCFTEFNQNKKRLIRLKWWDMNKEEINRKRTPNPKKRGRKPGSGKGPSKKGSKKEYDQWYYYNVTKPKRQEASKNRAKKKTGPKPKLKSDKELKATESKIKKYQNEYYHRVTKPKRQAKREGI